MAQWIGWNDGEAVVLDQMVAGQGYQVAGLAMMVAALEYLVGTPEREGEDRYWR